MVYYMAIMGLLDVSFTPGPKLMGPLYLRRCWPCERKKDMWQYTSKGSENFPLEVAHITSAYMPVAPKSQLIKLDIKEVAQGWGNIKVSVTLSSFHREVPIGGAYKEWQYFQQHYYCNQRIIKVPFLTPPLRKLNWTILLCFLWHITSVVVPYFCRVGITHVDFHWESEVGFLYVLLLELVFTIRTAH